MSTESFFALALPYSVRPAETDDDFNVSVFIAPKLVPDNEEEMLERFPVFADWALRVLDSVDVRLENQFGVIEGVEPLVHKIDPGVYRELFPADRTPVRANRVPDWSNRDWRSFDAGLVANIAKLLHVANVTTSLAELPTPNRSFLGKFPRVIDTGDDRDLDIDGFPGAGEPTGYTPSDWLKDDVGSDRGPGGRIIDQLHRVRRFYERREEQMPYRGKPDPDARTEKVRSPEPEYHERCAMAGDHPTLLRRLGLVIDLRVKDLDKLRHSSYLTVTVNAAGADGMCRSQRVLCQAHADGAFTTVGQKDGEWEWGALALGDESRFSVIDIDADGSALKTERFLGVVPQLLKVHMNGDPATAATPALRAGGFTIARRHRAFYSQERLSTQAQIEAGAQFELHTESVVRGMRVEVWDDTVGRWRSLHERESRIEVGEAGQTVAADDEGFVQGAAATESVGVERSKIYLHEALAGWEGWSLSVERPGKRIRFVHDGDPELGQASRREIVEDTPATPLLGETPPHPVRATHQVVKGSLPRLRFGRDYAFRAWAVDLAGNSRPHELDPPVLPNLAPVLPQLSGLIDTPAELAPTLASGVRVLANESLEAIRLESPAPAPVRPLRDELVDAITTRLSSGPALRSTAAAAARRTPSVSRSSLLERLSAEVVADPEQPLVADTSVRLPERLTDLVASQVTAIGGLEIAPSLSDAAIAALGTVSKLKPFLRWDPVIQPAIVPLKKYTEGESVRVLVIRSGVTQDEDYNISVTDPEAYAAAANSSVTELGYGGVSSRHLAPPKTSQVMAELHGMFDDGIGSQDASKNQAMLNWALVESGSLLDKYRWSLDDPTLQIEQVGRALVTQSPRSIEKPEPADPANPQPGDLLPGDPLGPGQYVVHDVEELTLPYLPDPMAVGVSLRFPDAEKHGIPSPEGTEGFTARYPGEWPAIEPFRLDLEAAPVLGAAVKGRQLSVRLPASDVQRFRLSSSLMGDEAPTPALNYKNVMGVWRSMAPKLTADPDVQEAARDGWIWGLTPSEDVMLVHAVPRPLEKPTPRKVRVEREQGQNSAALVGIVDVHGPSTDSVIAEATWRDPTDIVGNPGQGHTDAAAIAFQTKVGTDEDLLVLEDEDGQAASEYGPLRLHKAVHEFGDTKHRNVTYTLRATTRFREYFHPDLLIPSANGPAGDDGQSVLSEPFVLDVPSSAPPAAPVVHSVIPLFRWENGTEAEQPMAFRHDRRVGVRIYLERPWFSSGEGELLGVLLARNGNDEIGPPPKDQSGFPFVSKIGADPIWTHRPVSDRAMSLLHLDSLVRALGHDDRPQLPGRPVEVRDDVYVTAAGNSYNVVVAGYKPEYNAERELWYVDVAIDPWATASLVELRDQWFAAQPEQGFWPFVRLAVARFQPSSVRGCHLSEPVRCDFVQLPPERHCSVSRTDERRVRVVVAGTRGWRNSHPGRGGIDVSRIVVATLQQRDPQIPTDLGWKTVDKKMLPIRSDHEQFEVAWMGELDAGKPFAHRRPEPEGNSRWRVTVEEWERFDGDPTPKGEPTSEKRLVYADSVLL